MKKQRKISNKAPELPTRIKILGSGYIFPYASVHFRISLTTFYVCSENLKKMLIFKMKKLVLRIGYWIASTWKWLRIMLYYAIYNRKLVYRSNKIHFLSFFRENLMILQIGSDSRHHRFFPQPAGPPYWQSQTISPLCWIQNPKHPFLKKKPSFYIEAEKL